MGLEVELEHALHNLATDVTGNDPLRSGRIAVAHLTEFAANYTSFAHGAGSLRVFSWS
jgi:hypothetical protein